MFCIRHDLEKQCPNIMKKLTHSTDDNILSAIELMTPNLIGEYEFAVFLKDDHMVII